MPICIWVTRVWENACLDARFGHRWYVRIVEWSINLDENFEDFEWRIESEMIDERSNTCGVLEILEEMEDEI